VIFLQIRSPLLQLICISCGRGGIAGDRRGLAVDLDHIFPAKQGPKTTPDRPSVWAHEAMMTSS
jgi:hypothetical protein